MMIIDIPRDDGTLRAGIIGSCRVYAPIGALVRSGAAKTRYVARGVFSYTAAEAVQELSCSRGLLDIPDRFAPLLLNRASVRELPARLPSLIGACRVFLIEISTLDHLACGDLCFNDLTIANQLVRGCGPGMMAWFRQLSGVPSPPAIVEAALDSLRASGRPADALAREVVASLIRVRTRPDALSEGLARIVFARRRRWIFLPLFSLPDGADARRAALRDHVASAAANVGVEYFDLTPLVAQAGRATALDAGGADPYHFASDFEPAVGDALRDVLIGESLS